MHHLDFGFGYRFMTQTDTEAHILVIDDDDRLRDLLRRFLEESGFRVTDAASAIEASSFMSGTAFDLLVIDVMMPGMTGVEFLKQIRQTNNVPALFLTAMGETENRIDGLEAGADDYIAKPFEPRELILRIRRILDRGGSLVSEQQAETLSFGNFRYNLTTGVLTHNEKRVHLTSAEQELLSCFAARPDMSLSREDVSDLLQGRMRGRSIDVAVARLRQKLENDPRYPVYLQTIRGIGWALRLNSD